MRTIIACYHVPHNNFIVEPQPHHLRKPHVTVRRAKQIALYQLCGFLYIGHIILCPESDTLNMVEGVVAHFMSPVKHHLVDFRVLAYIVANTKEGGLYTIFVESIQNPRGNLGNWSVVEGEIYTLLLGGNSPDYPWKQRSVKERGLFYKHTLLFAD